MGARRFEKGVEWKTVAGETANPLAAKPEPAKAWMMRLAGGLRFPQRSEGERAVKVRNRWKSPWLSGKRGVIPGRRIAATDCGSEPFIPETEGGVTWAFPQRHDEAFITHQLLLLIPHDGGFQLRTE
jgi:hypothetical protein